MAQGMNGETPQSAEQAALRGRPVIVGIGASAGGVVALQTFFEALPDSAGAAFVVVVHLDPQSHSELPRILAARTRMPVVPVGHTMPLEPDHVYVIPPNRRLHISDHEISAVEFDEPSGRRVPIDLFLRSLAEHGDGFAVILTGAGSDGAVGVKAVKESGGIILIQDPEEAEYPSMPRSAIATGVADFVLPVRQIADSLVELIRSKERAAVENMRESDEEVLRRILAHVRVRTGHDFSNYKKSTVVRRVARRMHVTRRDDLAAYFDFMRDNVEEAQALLGDLLISVTTFFRDPEAFDVLSKQVIPRLFDGREASDTVRVWVPGCATGEEAYSIAILLLEEVSRREIRPEIQVFGSDLDTGALAIAREGRYPIAIEADVNEERLRRFFSREGDHYRIRRELRDLLLFASHSVLKDPPFSRVDLISCRNLLIYLDRDLQQQLCMTFHYALNPGGYLFLGSSETADSPPGLFHPIDRKFRLYQSSAQQTGKPRVPPKLVGALRTHDRLTPWIRPGAPLAAPGEAAFHRQALEQLAPPSALVDETFRAVHLSDNAGRYFQPGGGQLSNDITELVRPELRFDLRSALQRAFERNESTLSLPLLVQFNGAPHRTYLQVRPLQQDGAPPRRAVVIFIEGEAAEQSTDVSAPDGERATDETVRKLHNELEASQQRLRTVREESEGTNEELRAANEELQSINEEYRSTAEELETSKEELQSINEELQTVNNELKLKLEAESRAHSDLQNFVAATDVGMMFIDPSLRIRRFTPRITDLFSITASDEGRLITDFAHQLEYEALVGDAHGVLERLTPLEREVRSRKGRWYDMRMRPYRTVDNKIDGIVVSFVDITERHRNEEALRESEARLQLLLRELTHRVKNTLTIVKSMVHQTLRTAKSDTDFVDRFEGRLNALANAHELLVDSNWNGADLKTLARTQLAPYTEGDRKRVHIEGEPVLLPAELATPFALVMHELATNATKYGALKMPSGTISLNWHIVPANGQQNLSFRWEEKDGPRVRKAKKTGLGSSLIERGIPGAKVQHEFLPQGIVCTIDVPLPKNTERRSRAL